MTWRSLTPIGSPTLFVSLALSTSHPTVRLLTGPSPRRESEPKKAGLVPSTWWGTWWRCFLDEQMQDRGLIPGRALPSWVPQAAFPGASPGPRPVLR